MHGLLLSILKYATTVGIICLHDLTSFLVTQIAMNWCIENLTNF